MKIQAQLIYKFNQNRWALFPGLSCSSTFHFSFHFPMLCTEVLVKYFWQVWYGGYGNWIFVTFIWHPGIHWMGKSIEPRNIIRVTVTFSINPSNNTFYPKHNETISLIIHLLISYNLDIFDVDAVIQVDILSFNIGNFFHNLIKT